MLKAPSKTLISWCLLLLWVALPKAWAQCQLSSSQNVSCQFQQSPTSKDYFYLEIPRSSIEKVTINGNLLIKNNRYIFENMTTNYFVAKTAYPIPKDFLNYEDSLQKVEITFNQAPPPIAGIKISTNILSVFSQYKFLYISLFTLIFSILLFFVKREFGENTKTFKYAIATGVVLSLHLYLCTLHPFYFYREYGDLFLKIILVTTSVVTNLLMSLTDEVFAIYKRHYYRLMPFITLAFMLVLPGWKGDIHHELIFLFFMPSMILTTVVGFHFSYLTIKKYKYYNSNMLIALIVTGVLSIVLSLVDTYLAGSEMFTYEPISGIGLLLFYLTLILTTIILTKQTKLNKLVVDEEIAGLSRQVAHDIKSPLTALKIVTGLATYTSEDRHFIKNSVERISDIITDLEVSKARISFDQPVFMTANALIENLISEKKFSNGLAKNCKITNLVSEEIKNHKIKINRTILERMLSNLINNALEAISDKVTGEIQLKLQKQNEQTALFSIIDNGGGIPEDLIDKVTKRHFTFGKTSGQGLGLSYVDDQVKKWHGNLTISSQKNHGTTITFTVPLGEAVTPHGQEFILIDNDLWIRKAWEMEARKKSITLHLFSSVDAFLSRKHEFSKKIPVYIDSELGVELPGEVLAKHIYEAGFSEIYLATGQHTLDISNYTYLKSLTGKSPPF